MTKDGPFWLVACAVGSGAALGAILRWALSYALNARIEQIPLGTLAANWLGGYLIGLAAAGLSSHPAVSPAARLFIVTGFLGGLTTFSTFSSEADAMLRGGAVRQSSAACAASYGRQLRHDGAWPAFLAARLSLLHAALLSPCGKRNELSQHLLNFLHFVPIYVL